MARIRVPQYAKRNAETGLKQRQSLPESKKFGLSASEAREKGITSGVRRAQQLIRTDTISESDAVAVKSFLARNKGQADRYGWTMKILGARRLWGGDKSGRFERYLERKLD